MDKYVSYEDRGHRDQPLTRSNQHSLASGIRMFEGRYMKVSRVVDISTVAN